MLKDYFQLAYRSVRQRKIRSWLTMIGIFIGIAAIVALISLSQGLQNAIADQFVKLGSDKLLVQAAGSGFGPPGTAVPAPLLKKDKNAIDKIQGVDLSVGRLIRIIQLEFNHEQKYAYSMTMPDDVQERDLVIESNDYKLAEGKFFERNDAYEVIIGYDFTKDYFEKEVTLRDRIFIQGKQFKVVGILKKSGNPQKDSALILPEGTMRTVLDIPDAFDLIAVKIKSGENLNLVSEEIKKELRKSRNVDKGKEDFTVETPEKILATLNIILSLVQGVLVGIAAISLAVGGIGIMNTMYTAVLERTKEIGIMKAVGAQNKEILSLFLIESGLLGLFGGLIGVLLGFGIAKSIELIAFQVYQSPLIQANISPLLMGGALLFAFLLGALSGALPAKQAAQLHPVDALRK